jgi:hypothetical protein
MALLPPQVFSSTTFGLKPIALLTCSTVIPSSIRVDASSVGVARAPVADTVRKIMSANITDAGPAEPRTIMIDRRLADPNKFAHVRRELSIDPL